MKLYVGGLPSSVTVETLKSIFLEFGNVISVNLVQEQATGQSRGFGFVEMPVREEAEKAISQLANKEIEGSAITVEQARQQNARSSRPHVRGGDGPRGGQRGRPGGNRGRFKAGRGRTGSGSHMGNRN